MQTNFKQFGTILSREEAKQIKGGARGTCGYKSPSGSVDCGVTKAEAQFMAGDGNWCCDSCATSTYCAQAMAER
jgi:hypothetical protein